MSHFYIDHRNRTPAASSSLASAPLKVALAASSTGVGDVENEPAKLTAALAALSIKLEHVEADNVVHKDARAKAEADLAKSEADKAALKAKYKAVMADKKRMFKLGAGWRIRLEQKSVLVRSLSAKVDEYTRTTPAQTEAEREHNYRIRLMDELNPRLADMAATAARLEAITPQSGKYLAMQTTDANNNLFLTVSTPLSERMYLTITREGLLMKHIMNSTEARVAGYLLWKRGVPNAGKHAQYVNGAVYDVITYLPAQRAEVHAAIFDVMVNNYRAPFGWYDEDGPF